ncbi:hypothetical protein ACWD4O_45375 [Streptomyces sp. NPDC002623]
MSAAAAAYDGEDAACALPAGKLPQRDGRVLAAPDEVGQEGGGLHHPGAVRERAHAATEYVGLASLDRLTDILTRTIADFCS